MPDERTPSRGGPPEDGRQPVPARALLTLLVLLLLAYPAWTAPTSTTRREATTPPVAPPPQSAVPLTPIALSYGAFLAQVQAGHIRTAELSSSTASGDFSRPYVDAASGHRYRRYITTLVPVADPDLVPLLLRHHVQVAASAPPPPWPQVVALLLQAALVALGLGLCYMVWARRSSRRQHEILSFRESRARLYREERPGTTFRDVAGIDAAKGELAQEVDYLRNPWRYQRLGARIPKGVLLVGPPGTGKTLLARAVAGEAEVPFFSISATEFIEVFVGVGASRVRDLFEKARTVQPCIIFIDEIDAIGRRRSGGPAAGSNDEREQTLNQMLVAMDGFEPSAAVIVLAATNRPDVLDPALLRPGRFDRQVLVDPPDRGGREAILTVHTRHIPLAPEVSLANLAQATPGMSGADLANLSNEAALTAARKGATTVTSRDFEEALDRITLGAPGAALIDEEERRTVAYHEAGHALVALLSPHGDPVHRVTIVPRGRSLGVTQFRPLADRRNYRRASLYARLAIGLGGRAAEEVACAEITSGAQNDLQEVARLARLMVTQLGMADDLGLACCTDPANDQAAGPWEVRPYSEETARRIDTAIQRLIDEAHERARALLTDNRGALDAIAAALLREESLDGDALAALVSGHGASGVARPMLSPSSRTVGAAARCVDGRRYGQACP